MNNSPIKEKKHFEYDSKNGTRWIMLQTPGQNSWGVFRYDDEGVLHLVCFLTPTSDNSLEIIECSEDFLLDERFSSLQNKKFFTSPEEFFKEFCDAIDK